MARFKLTQKDRNERKVVLNIDAYAHIVHVLFCVFILCLIVSLVSQRMLNFLFGLYTLELPRLALSFSIRLIKCFGKVLERYLHDNCLTNKSSLIYSVCMSFGGALNLNFILKSKSDSTSNVLGQFIYHFK